MEVFLILLLSFVFFWIAWQDFKNRNVLLISFMIGYGVLGVYFGFYQKPVQGHVLMNLSITGFIGSITGMYYLIKYGQGFAKRIKTSIGLGDMMMLPILVFYFQPGGFVRFLIISFLVSILYWWITKVSLGKDVLIPLAGIQSLFIPFMFWYEFLLSV